MREILPCEKVELRASVVACVLERDFSLLIVKTAPRWAGVGRLLLPHLPDPALEFIRIEVAVPAIGKGCERSVRKHEQRRVGTFRWPRLIPGAGHGTHVFDATTAEQAHDINLVCRLVEYRAAAQRRVEFLRSTRAVQIVSVIDRIDHTHIAVPAAFDQVSQVTNRRIERMTVANDKMHACAASSIDDCGTFL